MSNLKNVVIVGAASGATLARALDKSLPNTHRVVLIDASESAYWPIGALRGAVVAGEEEKVFARLDNFFPAGSRHIVLNKTKVTAISEKSVTIDHAAAPFNSTEIPVEYAVLATGSLYGAPCRPSSTSTAEAKASLKKQQADIAAASSILIIGGGPVAIEFAGEVLAAHPGKKVTLVTRGATLLGGSWAPKFPAKLEGQLKKVGVSILYNSSIDVPSGVETNTLLPAPVDFNAGSNTISADFVLLATGGKPNVELVPEAALEQGRIAVDSSLRLTYAPLSARYFSIGDASNAEGSKTIYAAGMQVPVVAAQIGAAIKNSTVKKEWKAPAPMMSVPVGPRDGTTLMMGMAMGGWVTSTIKGKTLFNSMFTANYAK